MVGVDGERSSEWAAGSHVQGDVNAGAAAGVECSAVVLQALDEILGLHRRLADGLGISLEFELDGTVWLQRHDLVQAGCSGAAVAVFVHAAAASTSRRLLPPFRVEVDGQDRVGVFLLEPAAASLLVLSQQVDGRHCLAAAGAGAGWQAHGRGQLAGLLLLAARLR